MPEQAPPPPAAGIRYGTPNLALLSGWLRDPPVPDGPFWALNLMRYRERAQYADGRSATLTGREADDAYAPLGPLHAIGAVPVLLADVLAQPLGAPAWERVGVVRYPSRAAFFAMQRRKDFAELHAHKDAGMEFTIVLSCLPENGAPPAGAGAETDAGRSELWLTVTRGAGPAATARGISACAHFDVEGVIIGDERTWTSARFDLLEGDQAQEDLLAGARAAEEAVVLHLSPALDLLAASVLEAAPAQAAGA